MDNILEKTDQELVKLALADKDSFLFLLQKYEAALLRYIIRISGVNREDAQDILQEVFIKIYQNLNDYNPKLKFSSWAYRITRNQTISELRKKKARPLDYYEPTDLNKFASEFNLINELDNQYLNKDIQIVLNKLKPKYKEVMILRFLEDKNYEEISDILKKPMGTVSALINRARDMFKENFNH